MAGLVVLFRFHLPTLADTILRFSHCISTHSNGESNLPRIVASATHSRGDVSVAGVGVETVVPPLPTPPTVYSMICLRRTTEKANRRAHTVRAHTPANRTPTATATPPTFTSATANAAATSTPSGVTRPLSSSCSCSSYSDRHSTLATKRHPPVRYLTIDRSMGMK